jgi:tetratricopeptide (TPR) repeat protein
MPTIAEAFEWARLQQQAGNLAEAEQVYRQILDVMPQFADARHLLGVVAYQRGDYRQAIADISQAITLQPNDPYYYNNLGAAYRAIQQVANAKACYERALSIQPQYAEANNNLGNILKNEGKCADAVVCYQRALQAKPEFAEGYYNLGSAWNDMQQYGAALTALQKAIALKPDYADAHNAVGCLFQHFGDLERARLHFQSAAQLKPDFAEAHVNLGNVLRDLKQSEAAIACYREAIRWKPDLAEAYNNLGNVLLDQKNLNAAADCYLKSIALRPDYAEGHYNLGNIYKEQERLEEAIACYRRALQLHPQLAYAHHNLGSVFNLLERLEEAIACYRRTLELQPQHVEAHNNLGSAYQHLGRFEEAKEWYRRALVMAPENPDYHMNLATLCMLQGELVENWQEYEWRWQTKEFVGIRPSISQPVWQGESLQNKTLLLSTEQGFGDTLQFIRYAHIARKLGAEVIFRSPSALVTFLQQSLPEIQVISREAPLPACDYWLPLMSMMRVLNTDLTSIPADVPYLRADAELIEKWQTRLAAYPGFRIGIHWRGRPGLGKFRLRDLPLEMFAPLAAIPQVRLVRLQFGAATEEEQRLQTEMQVVDFGDELDRDVGAFMDTAAIMQQLDLVITSDTSIAHLAGGLGVRTWVPLPLVPDWRWLLTREDSPWYPTMRLFRQSIRLQWSDVFARMEQALRTLLTRHNHC